MLLACHVRITSEVCNYEMQLEAHFLSRKEAVRSMWTLAVSSESRRSCGLIHEAPGEFIGMAGKYANIDDPT